MTNTATTASAHILDTLEDLEANAVEADLRPFHLPSPYDITVYIKKLNLSARNTAAAAAGERGVEVGHGVSAMVIANFLALSMVDEDRTRILPTMEHAPRFLNTLDDQVADDLLSLVSEVQVSTDRKEDPPAPLASAELDSSELAPAS